MFVVVSVAAARKNRRHESTASRTEIKVVTRTSVMTSPRLLLDEEEEPDMQLASHVCHHFILSDDDVRELRVMFTSSSFMLLQR